MHTHNNILCLCLGGRHKETFGNSWSDIFRSVTDLILLLNLVLVGVESLRLHHFKSDQDEIWQDHSSSPSDPSDPLGHWNTGDWCSRAGRGQIVLVANRNGGMLRLIAPRHDDDDDSSSRHMDWQSRISDMTSYIQDGSHDVILENAQDSVISNWMYTAKCCAAIYWVAMKRLPPNMSKPVSS